MSRAMHTMRDGTAIAVDVSGEGRPIVFVHGWGMHGGLFARQRAAFTDSHQIITFDQRGHGRSAAGPKPPTLEHLSDDLCELFDQLGLSNAVCVGWSMGAMVVWRALMDRSFVSRVRGVASIDMSPRITNDAGWSLGLADGRGPQATILAADQMRRSWRAMARRFVPRIFAPDASSKIVELAKDILPSVEKLDAEVMASLWESMAVQDLRHPLSLLSTPLLAAHGAKSQLYRLATGEYIENHTPQAELAVFENSGHAPHLEEPEAYNARLGDFIRSLSSTTIVNAPSVRTARS